MIARRSRKAAASSAKILHRKSLKRCALSRKRPFMGDSSVKKILVVDDDVGLMRVMREALIRSCVAKWIRLPTRNMGSSWR